MLSVKKLVVIVLLPLMFGAIIFAGLQQMRESSLNPRYEEARQDINQEARHMVIGRGPEGSTLEKERAEEQFRDLVIYSQVSAVNCQLLYWIHGETREREDDDENEGGNRLSKYRSGSLWPSKIDQGSNKKIEYSIPGRDNDNWNRPFNYLERSNYVPTCVGTGNAISHHVVDKRTQAANSGNLFNIAFQFTLGTLAGGLEDLWNMANCKLEPSWLSNRGNDMEGRYGAISFDSKVTIFPGKDSGGRIWAAQFLNEIGNCPADNEEFVGPEFFEANEWMDYLPYPDEGAGTPSQRNYGVNGNDPPFNEHQSAESDAIIDAPILTNEDIDDNVDGSDYGDNGGPGWGDFPRREVWYVICEGAQGKVQTNANTIENEGEAVWGKNNNVVGEYRGFESRVFTFIRITENATNCLENQHYQNPEIVSHDNLGSNGESCDSLSDANEGKIVEHMGQEYECVTRRYRWNSDGGNNNGELLTHIWEIGWIRNTDGSTSGPAEITDLYNFIPSDHESNVVTYIDNGLLIEPGNSEGRDYMRYILPSGNKEVSIELKFRQRGHVQFDFRDGSDNTITYTNTDLYGNEHLYIQSPEGYTDTEYDYPVDDVFTINFERDGDTNSWEVKNDGEIKWSNSMNMQDPSELVIESWRDPEVEIREIELENN